MMALLPSVSAVLDNDTLTAVVSLSRDPLPEDQFAFYLIADGDVLQRSPYSASRSVRWVLPGAGTYAVRAFLRSGDRQTARTSEPVHYLGPELADVLLEASRTSGANSLERMLEVALQRQEVTVRQLEGQLAEIRGTLNELQRTQTQARYSTTREVEALHQLYALVQPALPMPVSGWWAMSPLGLLTVVEKIYRGGVRSVIELGSGTSTVWMAYAFSRFGGGHVTAVEHDEGYACRTEEILIEHGLSNHATVRRAPLRHQVIGAEEYRWYELDAASLRPNEPADLLLVDGPPASTGENARYPALHFLHELLAEDAWLVLDDFQRADERRAVDRWLHDFPNLTMQPSASREQAVLRFRLPR